MTAQRLRIGDPLYGGACRARLESGEAHDPVAFALPGELVEISPTRVTTPSAPQASVLSTNGAQSPAVEAITVLEPSPGRTTPLCPHFGPCGGCHYQMAAYEEQLRIKRTILGGLLQDAGLTALPGFATHAAEPWGYRNRIRLRIQRVGDTLRFGYNIRTTTTFLPITTCPISAPNLVPTAEALLALAVEDRDAQHWLDAAVELELFTSDDLSRIQLTLFCAPRTKSPQGSFGRMIAALRQRVPQVAGGKAEAFDTRTGPTGRVLAEHGATGLNYRVTVSPVSEETYWISRGGFFQVNRFLIARLVALATIHNGNARSGNIAWDLFAGVGLFSRVLARKFAQVTAVEASPTAAHDLRNALAKLGTRHRAVQQTTLDFLREAVVQRERPELIVLDPPRAGVGVEACALLARIAASHIVYVSCDPTTLARDLVSLQPEYRLTEVHLIDLFPQTFHIETVVLLERAR